MHDTHTPAEPDASQYAGFFDAAPCAGWMFDARTLQIVHANRAAVDIYGFTRAEFLGMTLDQLAPDEDRAAVRRQLHEAPAGADGAAQRHCTRTGVIFGVQLRWVRPPGARRRAPAGTVVAWAERQAAAPEPVATRDEEGLAFREAPVGLLQLDDAGHIAGHIRRVNVAAATLLRASSSELSGRPFATLLHDDNETAAVPLLRVGDRWTGMLRVRRIDGHPIEVEASTHRTPAGPCLIALHDVSERVRAEDELRRSQERYRRLSNRTRHVREEERARLSRDLHDRLGQALTGLKMDLAWLLALCERFEPSTARSTIAGMMDRIDTTIAVVRRISADLRPGVLDRLGLQAAIEWRAREFERQTGVRCRVGTAGEVPSLDERQSTELFRILEELLTNVSRHAKATRVRIVMKGHRGKFALQVYDNGRGIAPDAVEGEYSIGLIGMRERATLLGGTMTLGRGRRGGTMAVVRVPVHPRLVSQTAADGALE